MFVFCKDFFTYVYKQHSAHYVVCKVTLFGLWVPFFLASVDTAVIIGFVVGAYQAPTKGRKWASRQGTTVHQ